MAFSSERERDNGKSIQTLFAKFHEPIKSREEAVQIEEKQVQSCCIFLVDHVVVKSLEIDFY